VGMFLVLVCHIAYDYIRYYYCMARVDEVIKGLQLLSETDRLFSVWTIINYNLFLSIWSSCIDWCGCFVCMGDVVSFPKKRREEIDY
jgi:hypothetical protein